MAKYWANEPIEYVVDGAAVCHKSTPNEPIELDDETAKLLGAKVRALDVAPVEVAEPDEAPVEAPKPRRPRGGKAQEADGATSD